MMKNSRQGEGKSAIDRFVGGTESEAATAMKNMEEIFRQQESAVISEFKAEKTKEDFEMIEIVNQETDRLREKYGLPAYDVPPENVHILASGAEPAMKELFQAPAIFVFRKQLAVIVEGDMKVGTTKKILHETIHFKSFASVDVEKGGRMQERRLGLSIYTLDENGQDSMAFVGLNEAVTEAQVKRSMRRIEQAALFAPEVRHLSQARKESGDDVAYGMLGKRYEDGTVDISWMSYSYQTEREALDVLIDKLVKRNPGAFADREACFEMFASAAFNGHLLEIARVIEKTFGEGAFRKLGAQKDGAALLAHVESL